MSIKKERKKLIKFRSYQTKEEINIGNIIFLLIFIYLVFVIISYLTTSHISTYEVRTGAILKDNSYTGIVLREETPVTAEASGYIEYYLNEGTKIGKNNSVYTISDHEIDTDDTTTTTEATQLSAMEQHEIASKIQSFNSNYTDSSFSDTYSLKNDIQSVYQSSENLMRIQELEALDENASNTSVYKAVDDGILIYSIDGYENETIETITTESFNKSNYKSQTLNSGSRVTLNAPIYKIITQENWSVIIRLSEETKKELSDTTNVNVRFTKDDEIMKARLNIVEKNGVTYGELLFNTGMVRYATERFLDIELILDDKTGLKIPKTSLVEKEVYVIPGDYITSSGTINDSGILLRSGSGQPVYESVDVYRIDSERNYYVSNEKLSENQILIKENSNEAYTVDAPVSLQGVYNINKGYAVFRCVTILCESDEYYIIKNGDSSGLVNYDHIALHGNTVQDNDIVF